MKSVAFCFLLLCLAGVTHGKQNARGVKIRSDSASVEFGLKSDVALRRMPDGSLGAEAKYFRANAFMVGDVKLEDFIEKTIRKRIVPHIQSCDPGWQGAFCDKSSGTQQLSGGNDGKATNLKACFGECDNHAQCAAGLKCFQRSKGEAIPGCHGLGGGATWDYCYDPKTGGMKVLGGGNSANAKDLARCFGECDNDSHCAYGLKCFQRSNGEAIPGCTGAGGGKDWDYCYDPNLVELVTTQTPKTTAPPKGSKQLGGGNDGKATNLKVCFGECDNHAQCATGLKCFQRSKGEAIPGCHGAGGGKDWDYCYDPKTGGMKVLGGGNSGNAKDLAACFGECDKDSHCAYGLKCFQRSNGEAIPGCTGAGGGKDWDYCYDPNLVEVVAGDTVLGGTNDGKAKNLKACKGECDNDGQCAKGLKCFQRSNGEAIPGCKGPGGGKDWDYCYKPVLVVGG